MSLLETNRFDRKPASAPESVAYPAEFHFRIIADVQPSAEAGLCGALAVYKVTAPLAPSQVSSGGRYKAFSVSVEIQSQAELHAFDAAVKRVPGVRMLL